MSDVLDYHPYLHPPPYLLYSRVARPASRYLFIVATKCQVSFTDNCSSAKTRIYAWIRMGGSSSNLDIMDRMILACTL